LGRRPLGAILRSSNEPGELSQWLCHDDSTINIVLVIIIIIFIIRHKIKYNIINTAINRIKIEYFQPNIAAPVCRNSVFVDRH